MPSLVSEATGHVDMFAAFVTPNDVVVARVDRQRDPVNAAILDRNAAQLAVMKSGGRELKVHRIDIPTRQGRSWSSFTNIVMANDLLLLPTFDSDPRSLVERAVMTYRRLLPKHHLKTIDMSSMKQLQGALHCLSLNIPENAPVPAGIMTFDQALR